MNQPFYETDRISAIIQAGGRTGMTELQFFEKQIEQWKNSPQRKEQLLGELYYHGEHAILARKREVIGENGQLQEVKNLPNNRVVDNQYSKLVDQKTNYLLGKPFAIECKNTRYLALLRPLLNNGFRRTLRRVGEDCLNGAVGWLFFYYDKQGQPAFRRLLPFEVLPFWADDDHTSLDCALRLYTREVWEGRTRKTAEYVEIYKRDGIWRYTYENSRLTPDIARGEHESYLKQSDASGKEQHYNWVRIPLIAFRYNAAEVPLIRRVKTLQDGINTILSDWQNNMQEDARNTILILTEYDGQDLGEFRHNLAQFGVVKVRADGGVAKLTVEVNAENYKAILDVFKAKLIENARGFDAKDDRMSNSPNQMNIQSMYADIDLDANGMETELQASFEELLWFISQYFQQTGQGDFTAEPVTITFNRDVLVNESEAIGNCQKSTGILSRETVVAQHPWTVDVKEELERIENEERAEQEKANEYADAFRVSEPTQANGENASTAQ